MYSNNPVLMFNTNIGVKTKKFLTWLNNGSQPSIEAITNFKSINEDDNLSSILNKLGLTLEQVLGWMQVADKHPCFEHFLRSSNAAFEETFGHDGNEPNIISFTDPHKNNLLHLAAIKCDQEIICPGYNRAAALLIELCGANPDEKNIYGKQAPQLGNDSFADACRIAQNNTIIRLQVYYNL